MSPYRVLILNNYPMDRVLREVELEETPDHVLFGVNQLSHLGFEPIYLPYPAIGPWQNLQRLLRLLRLPLELGDLQQQVMALRLSRNADIVYAPCGSQTHLLQYLRAVRLFKLPIVTLMHHPFPKGKLDALRLWQRRLFIRGADRLPTLSRALAEDLKVWGSPASKLAPLRWGPDISFFGPWQPPGSGVIATGRTGRDFMTFAEAAVQSRCSATVIGLQGHLDNPLFHSSQRLNVIETRNEEPVPGEDRGWLKYPDLCDHMRSHAAIAIPLFDQSNLAGLTSLMDALGLGRAVLMTRNRHIDVDIEAEGIGFWIEPGDVDGWLHRLNWISDHPDEVQAMGWRARCMAEETNTSSQFVLSIASLLEQAIAGTR
jgi:glycosyltransferase involved in cell wall biosynthesis